MKSVFTALLFTLLLSATSFSQAVTCESQTFIYSADSANPQSVQSYCLQADGQLVAISGSPFSTGGSGAFGGSTSANRGIVSKDGSRMYVSNDQFGNSGFSGFVINKTTGVLTPMSGSPWFLGDSSHAGSSFALSPDGRYLYLTRNNAKGLKIYSLDETSGAPTEIGDISFATTPNSSPNGMELSPDGKWLAINFNTGNFLAMYSVGSDGLLTPVPGSVYTLPNYPMSVVFHPMKQILYVTTLAQSIFVYDIAVDGQLSLGQTLSTTAFAPRVIYISSDERFIYGTSETAGTIQRFSLNTETGRINALESTLNVTSGTSLLALSKNGDYLFSKGLNVPISTFSINELGDLNLVSTLPTSTIGLNLMINQPSSDDDDDDDDGECVPGTFSIQIKPPSSGTVPIKLRDTIPVAIMGRCDFDPRTELNISTARFESAAPQTARRGIKSADRDVDGDGILDLILYFNANQTTLTRFSTSASLSVLTLSNEALSASQSVRILK